MPNRPASPLGAPLPVALRVAEFAGADQLYEWTRLAAGPVPPPNLSSRATRRATDLAPALLHALIARGEPLIDLAVAAYADDDAVLTALWKRCDEALRLAIAGNRHRPGLIGVDLMDVLQSGNPELIELTLANPSMSSGALARVMERGDPLGQLSDDEWRAGVAAIARSPVIRLKASMVASFGTDGWVLASPEESTRRYAVFEAAWRLPHLLEPTEANARVLEALLGAASEFSPPVLDFGWQPGSGVENTRAFTAARQRFVAAMLQKWRRENTPGGAAPLAEFEPDYHAGVRLVVSAAASAAGLPGDELRFSDDRHTRLGYYRSGQDWTASQIREAFGRDGADFLREVIGNEVVHGKADLRNAIEECMDHADGGGPREELTRTWRAVGMALWRQDPWSYPGPTGRAGRDERVQVNPGGLVEALEAIEEEAWDRFAWDNVRLQDAEKAGGIDRVQATRIGVDATWRLSRTTLAALKRLSQEIEDDRRNLRSIQFTMDDIRRAVWAITAIVAIAAIICGLRRWL